MTNIINNKTLNLRYAPGISGNLHLGNLKILLLNYKKYKENINNKLIIRYDDTNFQENNITSFANIAYLMQLFQIDYSKIIFQTQNYHRATFYINQLVSKKVAFYCLCKKYDQKICECSNRSYDHGSLILSVNKIYNHDIIFKDNRYGIITHKKENIYNLVLTRSDGSILYNFMNVVNDIDENINYIIRGCDHINNTWKQIAIYQALNINVPQYEHIPLILNEHKQKLSKSKKNFISVQQLIKNGYLIQAIKEYIQSLDEKSYSNQCFQENKIKHINKNIINSSNDSIIFDLNIYCMMNKYNMPLNKKFLEIIDEIKYRHNNLHDLYNEIKIFEANFMPSYNPKLLIIYKYCLFKLNMENNAQISDPILRFILTGVTTGLSKNILKKYITNQCIKNKILFICG